ncbi:hypothetical protein HY772_06685 [Candidatus Woesearchaeota archaeon]|nr:hypothetical protein [Candidatus Woesearchaeota archaeon]
MTPPEEQHGREFPEAQAVPRVRREDAPIESRGKFKLYKTSLRCEREFRKPDRQDVLHS